MNDRSILTISWVGLAVGVTVACVALLHYRSHLHDVGDVPLLFAIDLRRLTFPTAGLTIDEHGAERLEIVTDEWMLSVLSLDSERSANVISALRAGVGRTPGTREDVLSTPDGSSILRFLMGVRGSQESERATYIMSLGDARIVAQAFPRIPGEVFDFTATDRLLRAFDLIETPRFEAEVLPGWRDYQQCRGPNSPIAKFILSMAPAPVRLGCDRTALRDTSLFTEADFRRGGRQIASDLIEFYVKDDPSAIRVDIWVDEQPAAEGRETIYEARLQVGNDQFSVSSTGDPHEVPVGYGEYDVTITLLNRGRDCERLLTEREWFDRDDLERYEVWLKHL